VLGTRPAALTRRARRARIARIARCRRTAPLAAVLALVAALAGCGSSTSTTQPTTTAFGLVITLATPDLLVGAITQAVATVTDVNGVTIPNAPVTWTAAVAGVITVTDSGVITAVGAGVTPLIAQSGAVADTITITVDVPGSGPAAIDSIRPGQLTAGQAATIYGHNFSAYPTGNVVTVGADTVTPTAADSTEVQLVVPAEGCVPAQIQTFGIVARGSAAADTASVAPTLTPLVLRPGGVAALASPAINCVQFVAKDTAVEYLIVAGNVTSSIDADNGFVFNPQEGGLLPLQYGGYGHIHRKSAGAAVRAAQLAAAARVQRLAAMRASTTRYPWSDARSAARGTATGATAGAPKIAARAPHPARVASRAAARRAATAVAARTRSLPNVRFDARMRAYERRRLAPIGAARALGVVGRVGAGGRSTVRAVPAVGDTVAITVPTGGCDTAVATTGVVQLVGLHSIIVQDVAAPSGGFAASDFAAIAAEFDQYIYPSDTVHFGGPSDVDGNGRVILYYTPQVNAISAAYDSSGGAVPGYFFAGDLFPRTAANPANACAASNVAEILYLLTPDPTATTGTALPVATVRTLTRTAQAHQLEHLINASNRLFVSDGQFEEAWLDEGLAESAEDFVGRGEYGFTDTQLALYAQLSADSGTFSAFFQPNALRYADWLAASSSSGATYGDVDTAQAGRGATWSLLRYAYDQYSGGTPANVTRALALGPTTGILNLQQTTGVPLDSLVEGWVLAGFISGSDSVAVIPAKYTYSSYNMLDFLSGALGGDGIPGTYPLAYVPIVPGSLGSGGTLHANGGAYYLFSSSAPTPAVSFQMLNADSSTVSFPGARLYFLRVY